jgi:hypothetical protein
MAFSRCRPAGQLGCVVRATVPPMHIEKETILQHLRKHGRHEDAIRADRELPDRIHRTQDVELLERWGIDPEDIEGETFRDRSPPDT